MHITFLDTGGQPYINKAENDLGVGECAQKHYRRLELKANNKGCTS